MTEPTPDIRSKFVSPSAAETAFNCPHCGALAKQLWYSTQADPLASDEVPKLTSPGWADEADLSVIKDKQQRERMRNYFRKIERGYPFVGDSGSNYNEPTLHNVFVSKCFNCSEAAIWIHNRMVFPSSVAAPPPNHDLPVEVAKDYREAGAILNESPRGAAALLRLAIQKICIHLGGSGANINNDIGALVKKGLDFRVQKALDVVRVIGNNAVHPGQIDISDDRATAEKLFGLINIIADVMITQPAHIAEMYGSLPQGALDQIARRDNSSADS